MHVVLLQRLNMGGVRAQAVFGDDHFEVGMIPTKLGNETLGGVSLTIIFLSAILLDNQNDCEKASRIGGEILRSSASTQR